MAKVASGGSGSLKVSASKSNTSSQSQSKPQGPTKPASPQGPPKPTTSTTSTKTANKVSGINANIPFVQLGTDPTKVYRTGDQQRDTASIYRELYKGNYKAGDFESNRSATYLNSILNGETKLNSSNAEQFHSFLKEAQDFEALHRQEGDTARADYWLAMANSYQDVYKYSGLHYEDNRAQYAQLDQEKADLTARQAELGSARNNANRSATIGMQSGNFLGEYAGILKDVKNNENRLKEIEVEQLALDDDLFDTFATDEEKTVRDRLKNYTYAPVGSWRASANPNILTEEDKAKDQAIYDNFMSGMGLDTRYLNRVDKVNAFVNSSAASIGEGLAGAASIAAKAAFDAGEAQERFEYDAEHGQGAYDALHAGEKEARDQRQLDAVKMQRGTFSDTAEEIAVRTRVSQGQQAVEAAQAEFDKAKEERDKYYQSGGALVEGGKMSEYLAGKKAVDDRYNEARQALEKAKGELAEMTGEETSLRYDMAYAGGEQTLAKVDAYVDKLHGEQAEEMRKALVEAKPLEKLVFEGGQTMVQMGFDMATAPMLGGSSLVPMFIRVLGQESANARRQGATTEQQLRYGLTKAGIELFTEKMFGAFDKIGYGKGFANELSERLVGMLAEGDLGRTILRTFLAMNEEGLEELISELLGPAAEEILRKGGAKEAYGELFTPEGVAQMLHSYLLGAALGGLGAVGGIVTSQNAEANQALNRNQAQMNAEAFSNYNSKFDSRVSELMRYDGLTEAQAEAKATEELGPRPELTAANTAAQKIAQIDFLFDNLEQITPDTVAQLRDSLPDEARLTQEEFNEAKRMGLLEDEDAPNYLVKGESAEDEVAPEASGEGVKSRLKKGDAETRKKNDVGQEMNRMRKLTDRIARAMGKLGYGYKGDQVDDFRTASGKTPAEVDAELTAAEEAANAASKAEMQEAEAQPKGGDASPYNLDNYDQAGINRLWKDRKMTSGQYAEAMVEKGFWSEATARNFLSLVRREGDRLGLNTADERKRNLGNYTIGQNNAQNAPQGQGTSEGTPVPAETEKSVKPQAESSEQSTEVTSKRSLDELLAETRRLSEENEKSWTKEELDALGRKNVPDMNSIVAQARRAARDGKYFSFLHSFGTEDPSRYVYDGDTVYKIEAGRLSKYASGLEALKFLDSPKVASSTVSWQPSDIDKATVDRLVEKSKLEWDRNIRRYNPTESEAKKAFDDYFDSSKAIKAHKNLATALSLATENHPFKLTASNITYIFDGKTLDTRNKATGGRVDKIAVVSGPQLENNHIFRIVDELSRSANSAGALPSGVTLDQIVDDFIAEANSTTQQENGITEEQKGAEKNGNKQPYIRDSQQRAAGDDPRGADIVSKVLGRDLEESRKIAEEDADNRYEDESIKANHLDNIEYFQKNGARYVSDNERPIFAKPLERAAKKLGINNVYFLYGDDTYSGATGLHDSDSDAFYFVLTDKNIDEVKHLAKHEFSHKAILEYLMNPDNNIDFQGVIDKALDKTSDPERNRKVFDRAFGRVRLLYATHYLSSVQKKYSPQEWLNLSVEEKQAEIDKADEHERRFLDRMLREEFIAEAIAGSPAWFNVNADMSEFQTLVRERMIRDGVIKSSILDDVDSISDFVQEKAPIKEEAVAKVDTSENEPVIPELGESRHARNVNPQGSGKMGKQSQSAAVRQSDTRGEENKVREQGTTYISKTNEERSRIADHQLREKNRDAEINRLINKDERWDDQDVVTAERAMYQMIRAIRDYQLSNKRKMPQKAFDALIKRYNALATRHINEKSKAGQELQATYQFTPAERIMNRMAKTFLGFAKDGTFAGKTELAVNAKIYAAAEDAANRITKAVEAKDAQALAQICKDISDIRGVKNMFGIASKFASKVENEILDSIAKQENGVEALETLALGNLNAICDDVQPYKIVNAAKTIRVMNMLSNMSTIMNNVTNNIASGLTSTNALAQGSSLLASKAFEKITGQKVLTPAAKGWVANKEIRNAEMEALKMATLVQMYGVNQENGKLEISGDKGLFNPNANAFEQTMAMYKFFIGMGVEATDQVKSEGLMKAMNIGIDKALAKEKITEKQAEAMRKEAEHEVKRLLYKDDNRLSGFVQGVRNKLNKMKSWGNDDIGTIGLGDIAMAFAKVPANVVRARLYATPEGCLVQLAQYTKGVMKAKRMHSEVMARQIMEKHAPELNKLRADLQEAKELETRIVGREAKAAKIEEINSKIAAVNRQCWNEAREQCSGGVYNSLVKKRDNYGAGLDFDDCVQRCKYDDAKEMSQFEAATYSRKIGKAATSAGMVALGAVLRGLGALRDFDQEPDDELRKMYKQKGYSGLMFNWSAIGRKDHEWRDGDIILDADFLEVVAMPLAIGACAKECAMNVEGKGKTKAFITEAGASGLSKTFEAVGDIPGMADAVNLYNAITSQFNTDNAAKGNRVFNAGVQYLANMLPSFFIPNAYTQLGAGLDNTVRDTYTTDNIWQQAGNIMLNKTAFLRKKIPASVDMWGEERNYGENKFWGVVNKTLLPGDRIKYRQNKYESEIIRLTKEGYKGATPKLSVSGSFEVDGETYTMDADEKRAFRQNRNSEQAEVYKEFMDSPEYNMLTDDQKVAVLKDLKMDCERDAKQTMLNDRGLDVEVTRAKWETELPTTKEQITYLSMKQIAGAAWDSEENRVSDYAAMDAFLKDHYGDMTKEMQDILDGSMSQLDKMYDARKVGIDSEMWQKAYDIYRQYNSDEGEAAVDGGFKDWEATEMWTKMEKATGASNAQMNWFEENMGLMRHMRVDPEHYQDLTDKLGWSRESASNLTKSMSELKPSNGNKTVSYKQRLRCIAESSGTTDDQKWEAFYEYCPSSYTKIINGMTSLRNRGYTYEQALKTYKSGKNSMWWVYEGE